MDGVRCTKCFCYLSDEVPDGKNSTRFPRLLNCGHSCCMVCVRSANKRPDSAGVGLLCPVCQEKSEGDVLDLPPDFYSVGLMHILREREHPGREPDVFPAKLTYKTMASLPENGTCGVCGPESGVAAVKLCLDCGKAYCPACLKKAHTGMDQPKHRMVKFSSEESNIVTFSDIIAKKCHLHAKPLEYFCEDCQILICPRCCLMAKSEHRSHAVVPVEEREEKEESRSALEQSLQASERVIHGLSLTKKTLLEKMESAVEEGIAADKAIRDHFHPIHSQLQAREDNLRRKVRKHCTDFVDMCSAKSRDLMKQVGAIEGLVKSGEKLLSSLPEYGCDGEGAGGDASQLFLLSTNLRTAKDIPCHLPGEVTFGPVEMDYEAHLLAIGNYGKAELGPLQDINEIPMLKIGDAPQVFQCSIDEKMEAIAEAKRREELDVAKAGLEEEQQKLKKKSDEKKQQKQLLEQQKKAAFNHPFSSSASRALQFPPSVGGAEGEVIPEPKPVVASFGAMDFRRKDPKYAGKLHVVTEIAGGASENRKRSAQSHATLGGGRGRANQFWTGLNAISARPHRDDEVSETESMGTTTATRGSTSAPSSVGSVAGSVGGGSSVGDGSAVADGSTVTDGSVTDGSAVANGSATSKPTPSTTSERSKASPAAKVASVSVQSKSNGTDNGGSSDSDINDYGSDSSEDYVGADALYKPKKTIVEVPDDALPQAEGGSRPRMTVAEAAGLPADFELKDLVREPLNSRPNESLIRALRQSGTEWEEGFSEVSTSSITEESGCTADALAIGDVITVVHIVSPSEFFVQKCDVKSDALMKLADAHDLCERLHLLHPPTVSVGTMVMAKFDGKWYRARILNVIEHGSVGVFYVDYGNFEFTIPERMCAVPSIIANYPPLAVKCALAGVAPPNNQMIWPQQSSQTMAEQVDGNELVVRECSTPVADLFNVDLSIRHSTILRTSSLRDYLVVDAELASYLPSLSLSFRSPDSQMIALTSMKYQEPETLQKSKELHVKVTYVYDAWFICFQRCGEILEEERREMMDRITEICEESGDSLTIAKPAVGMVCAVFFPADKIWYRGLITELPGGSRHVKVKYVDFGNSEVMSMDRVKALPYEFIKMPLQAYYCKLDGVKPFDDIFSEKSGTFLSLVVLDKIDIIVKIMSVGPPTVPVLHSVRMLTVLGDDICEILIESQVAASVESRQGPDGVMVKVTRVVSPSLFYVQEQETQAEYIQLCLAVQHAAENETPGKLSGEKSFGVGSVGAMFYRPKQIWSRVRITKCISDERVEVLHIDTGEEESDVLLDVIHCLPKFFLPANTGPFAHPCFLKGLRTTGGDANSWTLTSSESMATHCLGETVRLIPMFTNPARNRGAKKLSEFDENIPCDILMLRNQILKERMVDNPEVSLRDLLVRQGLALSPLPSESGTDNDVEEREEIDRTVDATVSSNEAFVRPTAVPPPGLKVPVVITELQTPNVVFVQFARLEESHPSLANPAIQAYQDTLNEFADAVEIMQDRADAYPCPSEPAVGKSYCAQFSEDYTWTRAFITEVVMGEDRTPLYKVIYFDFGNWEYVPRSRLRELPEDYMDIPAQALCCLVPGKQETSAVSSKCKEWSETELSSIYAILTDCEEVYAEFEKLPVSHPNSICVPASNITFLCSRDGGEENGIPLLNLLAQDGTNLQ